MPRIDDLLRTVLDRKGSDLHLTSGLRPYIREHGSMITIDAWDVLTPEANHELLWEITPPANRAEFERRRDTDFAYEIAGLARFRVNVFCDRRGIGAVLRQIPSRVPTADELGLPHAVRELCYLTKGLVVVTGPTGSGKSTTLAAMIDLINKTRTDHIITIEDPIEFVHEPQRCLVNQREIHSHTESFAGALRAALREDPDIVLVGEMRDLETMDVAIETAETGHLVFATLHTNTAATTVDRIINKFPADRQNQVRTMLADSLKGVIAQTLCRKIGGGRVAAMEILVCTPAVSANIREGKTHFIPSAMQVSKGIGMQTFTDSLMDLVTRGLVTTEEAYLKATDKESVLRKIHDAGLSFAAPVDQASSAAERAVRDHRVLQLSRMILDTDPNNGEALNNIAWILATNPDASLRDGPEAVRLAERALAAGRDDDRISIMDTLAAAYAEAGDFDKATATARQALEESQEQGRAQASRLLQRGLNLYEERKPLRDE